MARMQGEYLQIPVTFLQGDARVCFFRPLWFTVKEYGQRLYFSIDLWQGGIFAIGQIKKYGN